MSKAKSRTPEPTKPSDVLRATIKARGLTAYAVAKLAGLPRPDPIQRFLNGERGLRVDTFDAVCTALGLRLVDTTAPAPTLPDGVEPPRGPVLLMEGETPDPTAPTFSLEAAVQLAKWLRDPEFIAQLKAEHEKVTGQG